MKTILRDNEYVVIGSPNKFTTSFMKEKVKMFASLMEEPEIAVNVEIRSGCFKCEDGELIFPYDYMDCVKIDRTWFTVVNADGKQERVKWADSEIHNDDVGMRLSIRKRRF